jgi:hypothetical protein
LKNFLSNYTPQHTALACCSIDSSLLGACHGQSFIIIILFIFFATKLIEVTQSHMLMTMTKNNEQRTQNSRSEIMKKTTSWVLVVGLKVVDELVERRKEEAEP